MKKVLAIVISFVLVAAFLVTSYIGYRNIDFTQEYINRSRSISFDNEENEYKVKVSNYKSISTLLNNTDTICVFGSSELANYGLDTEPEQIYNSGNADFSPVFVGTGGCQSLTHAVVLSAITTETNLDKVVLILSPSWFYEEGVTKDKYAAHFFVPTYVAMLKNDRVSDDIKKKIVNRTNELLSDRSSQLDTANAYVDKYLNKSKDFVQNTQLFIDEKFRRFRSKVDTLRNLGVNNYSGNKVITESVVFDTSLLKNAEVTGKNNVTNNEFGMEDAIFDEVWQGRIENEKGALKDYVMTESLEYGDLCIFLDICKELDITPMLISVPMNGKFYDYCGLSEYQRNSYYQNIRDIADKYDCNLADYSDCEYEDFFLRDATHLGWKGWYFVNEDIYKFAKEN